MSKLVEQLEAVYAEIPRVACKGLCQSFCGPVTFNRVEWKRLCTTLGRTPASVNVFPGIPDLKPPPGHRFLKPADDELACALLTPAGRCSVYEARPLICRVFGAVERLRCPHGLVREPALGLAVRRAARPGGEAVTDEQVRGAIFMRWVALGLAQVHCGGRGGRRFR